MKKAAAAASATATKPKAFLSAGEKFKAERDKMKAGLTTSNSTSPVTCRLI
jgi:hypothetical protein